MKAKLFTKELFIETIEALKKQFELDLKNAKLIGEVFENVGSLYYNNELLKNQIFKILEAEFYPNIKDHQTNDIEYFCYDLDFGKEWKVGSVTDNDKDIKLQTIEDLWNYLTS